MIIGGSGLGRPLVEEGEDALGLVIACDIPLVDLGLPAARVMPMIRRDEQRAALARAGRNAPCPCGSGRKRKRCHAAAG